MPADRKDKRGNTEPVRRTGRLVGGVSSGDRGEIISGGDASGRGAEGFRRALAARQVTGEGALVHLYAIEGLTDPSVLRNPFYFQCPPLDDLTRSYAYAFNAYDTLRHGQMSSGAGRQLATLTLSTLFVSYDADWTFTQPTNNDTNPLKKANRLLALMRSGTPFGLTIGNRDLWRMNDLHWGPIHDNAATIVGLDITERGGETDARYVTVNFQEYRTPELRARKLGKDRGRGGIATIVVDREGTARRAQGSGVIMKDATLGKLCRKWYGKQAPWRDLAKANDIKNFSADRPLEEWVKRSKDKTRKLRMPNSLGHADRTSRDTVEQSAHDG